MNRTLTHLGLIADHDVILHGVGDVVDGEHQAGAIFDTGKPGPRPRDHVTGGVSSVDGGHIRLTGKGTFPHHFNHVDLYILCPLQDGRCVRIRLQTCVLQYTFTFFVLNNSHKKIFFKMLVGQKYCHSECEYRNTNNRPFVFQTEVNFFGTFALQTNIPTNHDVWKGWKDEEVF